jgi:hypothetical protein
MARPTIEAADTVAEGSVGIDISQPTAAIPEIVVNQW